jgi:hypothetical protein
VVEAALGGELLQASEKIFLAMIAAIRVVPLELGAGNLLDGKLLEAEPKSRDKAWPTPAPASERRGDYGYGQMTFAQGPRGGDREEGGCRLRR